MKLQLESLHWELDFDTLLPFIVANTLLQIPVWYFTGRQRQWSLFFELFVVHLNFAVLVAITMLMDIQLVYAGHTDCLPGKLSLYFSGFFCTHILALIYAEFYDKYLFGDMPYLSKRIPEAPWTDVLKDEFNQSLVDVVGYSLFVYLCPFPVHIDMGKPPAYAILAFSTIVTFLFADFIFYAAHGLILHGPLWFAHRAHHQIYKPTIRSARKFDALDWFFEFSVAMILSTLIFAVPLVKLKGEYSHFFINGVFSNAIMFSMIHHCGKSNIPNSGTHLFPWIEFYAVIYGNSAIEVHEGHHNWVSKNYGLIGFTDHLFGTLSPPKTTKSKAS